MTTPHCLDRTLALRASVRKTAAWQRWIFLILLVAFVAGGSARAQTTSPVHLTAQLGPSDFTFLLDCTIKPGFPICNGTYIVSFRPSGCANDIVQSGALEIYPIDPVYTGKPGPLKGYMTFRAFGLGYTQCSIAPDSVMDWVFSYSGTFDGSQGAMTLVYLNQPPYVGSVAGTFKVDVNPVFPMTVTTTIKNGAATSNAQMQFRPQDVGQQGSVFVFAMAPLSIVKDAVIDKSSPVQWFFRKSEKDLPVQCVLAQLSASGQLVGVSASTLQAYVTGVLSSQGAAVTILNGVPTVNIGGATFFVGYGSSGTSMLNGGINRAAVTLPGAQVCQPAAPQTGWWWNPAEDGRGFSIEKHGNNLFFASFLYDVSGRSTWYVSSGPVSLEGSLYVGDLLSASGGQTLGGAYPGFPNLDKVGTATITFNSATNGTLIWPGGTVPIQRQAFVPDGLTLAPMPGGPESGWWWNDQEAGRGFFLEFQGDWLDIAGYMYDEQGNSVWYLSVAQMGGADKQSFATNWWSFAGGQTLTGAWKHNTRTSDHVAPLAITFSGTDTALMTLPNGRTTTLKRQRF